MGKQMELTMSKCYSLLLNNSEVYDLFTFTWHVWGVSRTIGYS